MRPFDKVYPEPFDKFRINFVEGLGVTASYHVMLREVPMVFYRNGVETSRPMYAKKPIISKD